MVYDTTNPSSFEDIERFWINEVESYAEKNVELLLIGNKCDLAEQKNVNLDNVRVRKLFFLNIFKLGICRKKKYVVF